MHRGINLRQKHHPLFLAKPPLNLQTVQAPPFLGNPPSILAFREPPLKVFSFLTPSYLLKITKFLAKISQFEFLVMTKIFLFIDSFCHLLFQILVFYIKIATPLKKVTPSFPATHL